MAGVIGADALKGFVLDVAYAPCRLRLSVPGEAALQRADAGPGLGPGAPTVDASVSDDAHQIAGRFRGRHGGKRAGPAGRRPGPGAGRDGDEGALSGRGLAGRLPQVDFAGITGRDVAAGLMKPEGDVVGVLGGSVLAHFLPALRLSRPPAGSRSVR